MDSDGGTAKRPSLKTILVLDNGAFSTAKRSEEIDVAEYTEFAQEHRNPITAVMVPNDLSHEADLSSPHLIMS